MLIIPNIIENVCLGKFNKVDNFSSSDKLFIKIVLLKIGTITSEINATTCLDQKKVIDAKIIANVSLSLHLSLLNKIKKPKVPIAMFINGPHKTTIHF